MCGQASEYDSRGPGWYCCKENRYNEQGKRTCKVCGGPRCKVMDADGYAIPEKRRAKLVQKETVAGPNIEELKKKRRELSKHVAALRKQGISAEEDKRLTQEWRELSKAIATMTPH